jgi:hypothetical protein
VAGRQGYRADRTRDLDARVLVALKHWLSAEQIEGRFGLTRAALMRFRKRVKVIDAEPIDGVWHYRVRPAAPDATAKGRP